MPNWARAGQTAVAAAEFTRRTGRPPPGWEIDKGSIIERALPYAAGAAGTALFGPAGGAVAATAASGLTGGGKPGNYGGGLPTGFDYPHNGGLGFNPCDILFPSGAGPGYDACMGIGGAVGLVPPGEGAEPGEACPTGYTKVGGTCVANRPGAYLPGGQPATVPTTGTPLGTGWEAVTGSFGLPALTPLPVQRTRYECPAGMVLGKDNLCYPKSTPGLGRRGSFRKWKGSRRPKVSAAEWKQLQRAARTREKVKDVAKEAGWKVSKYGTRRGR